MKIHYAQSSVIPLRLRKNDLQILLITSLSSRQWIFPKGIIDDGLTAGEAAAKEAYEEAGVKGAVADILIGNYSYRKWGGICDVQVYPMLVKKVLKAWPEGEQRERRWVSLKKAQKLVEKPELNGLLVKLKKNLPSLRPALEAFQEK